VETLHLLGGGLLVLLAHCLFSSGPPVIQTMCRHNCLKHRSYAGQVSRAPHNTGQKRYYMPK
jgi:hypothetical protein